MPYYVIEVTQPKTSFKDLEIGQFYFSLIRKRMLIFLLQEQKGCIHKSLEFGRHLNLIMSDKHYIKQYKDAVSPSDLSKTYPRKCLNCCRQEQWQTKGHRENPLPLAIATRQRPRFHLNALPHTQNTLTPDYHSTPASPSPSQPSR